MRFAPVFLLPAAAGSFLAAGRLLVGPVVLPGGVADLRPVLHQQQLVSSPAPLVGRWVLCTTQWVTLSKKLSQLTRADTSFLSANVCTEVVFQADGVGHAGLENSEQYTFAWRQQGDTLTITYAGSPDVTRLTGGRYKMRFRSLPPSGTTPRLTELALSTARRTTHFLLR
jgi:hypothetical protein